LTTSQIASLQNIANKAAVVHHYGSAASQVVTSAAGLAAMGLVAPHPVISYTPSQVSMF